jgi:hypothetical protein
MTASSNDRHIGLAVGAARPAVKRSWLRRYSVLGSTHRPERPSASGRGRLDTAIPLAGLDRWEHQLSPSRREIDRLEEEHDQFEAGSPTRLRPHSALSWLHVSR